MADDLFERLVLMRITVSESTASTLNELLSEHINYHFNKNNPMARKAKNMRALLNDRVVGRRRRLWRALKDPKTVLTWTGILALLVIAMYIA